MGKKFFRTLFFALLFVLLTQASAWAETAVVTGNDVNLREGPGTGFRIITSLEKGARVTVTDRSNSSWYYVQADNAVGFMAAAYLEVEEEASAQPVENAAQGILGSGQLGYVDAMYVRLRSAPGSDYSVLGEYNRGKPLAYYGNFGDWAAVIIDGQPGFIYADYVRLGSFDGWNSAVGGDEEEDTSVPYVQFVPTPTPAVQQTGPSASEELSLIHALTPGVDQIPGYINANYVRFRKGPGSNYPIIDTYSVGTPVGVTGIYYDWTACYIDNQIGFIYSDYITIPSLQQQEPVYVQPQQQEEQAVDTNNYSTIPLPDVQFPGVEGYVAGNNVRMRWAPSMNAPILEELSYGNPVTVVGRTGDWAAVLCNGKPGYIYGSFLRQGSFGLTNNTGGETSYSGGGALQGSSAEKGYQIAKYALQFVGYPYSWGGRDPSGFDCSGFVYYVYEQFGITLNRVAQDQARNGYHVDASELQAGDILCFYSGSSYIGHVGIYLGYGMFVHAQNSATGVVITELAGHYSDRGFEARRIV